MFKLTTSARNSQLNNEVADAMMELVQDDMTMIVFSHEMGFAPEVADRLFFMGKREICDLGTQSEIFDRPKKSELINSCPKLNGLI